MRLLLLFVPALLSAQYMSSGALVSSRGTGPSYGHCKLVSTSAGMVSGGSNLSNYPLTVNLPADADLATVANGGYVTNAGGSNDIAFYSDCSGVAGGGTQVNPSGTKLTWEIESYTAASGALTAHVLKSTLLAAGDSVGMWFAGTATTFQSTASSVWPAAYRGVWHLPSTTVNDSTTNANNAASNTGTATSAQVDGGLNYSGQVTTLTNVTSMKPTSALTISAWVYRSGTMTGGVLTAPPQAGSQIGYELAIVSNSPEIFIDPNGLGNAYKTVTASSPLANTTWTHVVATWDGAQMLLYINGAVDGAGTANSAINYGTTANPAFIGENIFSGKIDEVRLLSTALTASWIQTEYRNQATNGCSGSPCLTVGALQ